MEKDIKLTRDFESCKDIDNIISCWAQGFGFSEDRPCIKFNPEDITYCFSLDDRGKRIIVAINILDDKVHMETWALTSVTEIGIHKQSINALLDMLGQEPI